MTPKQKKARLNKLINRVDEIHDMFRPDLKEIDLPMQQHVNVSTELYTTTQRIRNSLIAARNALDKDK